MPKSLEERVSYLEGTVNSNSRNIEDLRELLLQLNRRVDGLDEKVDRFRQELADRISGLEQSMNERMGTINERIGSLEQTMNSRVSGLEKTTNSQVSGLEQRMDRLDHKMSRQFMWIVGIQVAILLAVVGALLGT